MQLFHHFGDLPDNLESTVIIGNFDGVHRGHQALIARARARTTGTVVALTFDPHPVRLLAPALAPPLITPRAEKYRLLGRYGVDVVLAQRFDREFAALAPETFVRDVLARALDAQHVIVGYDFTFGARRAGKTADLERFGADLGFSVEIVEAQEVVEGLVASSSKVREFVLEGRMEGAALILGRHFSIWGEVVAGQQRGRVLGFPTANLAPETELLPRVGVYAGWLDVGSGPWPTVINVGFKPTFETDASRPTVEAHVLDRAGLDLYGRRAELKLLERLRAEQKFPNLDALRAAIAQDCQAARVALAAAQPL